MAWAVLLLAGLCEIGFIISLRFSEGFSKLVPTVLVLVMAVMSVFLLSTAMKAIPTGTAYAVWTAIGAVGAVTIGMVWFREPATTVRILGLVLVVGGILLLRVADGTA